MNGKYLETIVQYLIKIANNGSGSDKGILEKLDEVIAAVSNIKISAESVNLNTDELEDKLDSLISVQLKQNFLNPTHLGIVAEGDTTFDQNVVLCNITNDNISVTIMAADDSQNTTIILAPGWNPVVVKSITGVVENTLVYGY